MCYFAVAQQVSNVSVPLDTSLTLPFFDSFSQSNPRPTTRYWQQSQVLVNDAYATHQKTIGVATFDILDHSGRVYAHALSSTFYADTLASHAFTFAPADSNVYLSFYVQPAGLSDMPERQDSLLLYFFFAKIRQWQRVWAATTNGTLNKVITDTLVQHYFLDNNTTASRIDGKFAKAMVAVPREALDTGFRFRFVNCATRGGSQVNGMEGNCDLWHIDLVYLDKNRSAAEAPLADVAMQKTTRSFLKSYTNLPWRHLMGSSAARQEQLFTEGDVVLPHEVSNLSANPSPMNRQLRLSLTKGGNFSKGYDIGNINIFADSTVDYTYKISSTDLLNAPDLDADSVAFEVQFIVRQYNATPNLQAFLTGNDTSRFVQTFYDYYSYDDGSAENGFGVFGENTGQVCMAVKYKAYIKDELSGAYLYFNHTRDSGNLQAFNLTVWSSSNGIPGEVLYQQTCMAAFTGLNQFVYYPFTRPVVVEGEFFVGIHQKSPDMLNVGLDANSIVPNKTFVKLSTQWNPSSIDNSGSLMIRPSFARIEYEHPNYTPIHNAAPEVVWYPNPVHNTLYVNIPHELSCSSLIINIFNAKGESVLRSQTVSSSIDMSALPAGVYWLQTFTPQGKALGVQQVVKD
ncbi:hypothetical protein AGMMS4956_17850 [Bacteroidia bacterium]|nr:hypothetical protein AGMMS4956_17850 [Bacteroidia bacterium]